MSESEDLPPATPTKSEKEDRSSYGKRNTRGPWAHLDEETRLRYEAIEQRVREKWERGEL